MANFVWTGLSTYFWPQSVCACHTPWFTSRFNSHHHCTCTFSWFYRTVPSPSKWVKLVTVIGSNFLMHQKVVVFVAAEFSVYSKHMIWTQVMRSDQETPKTCWLKLQTLCAWIGLSIIHILPTSLTLLYPDIHNDSCLFLLFLLLTLLFSLFWCSY